jgi:hypothetical protein
MTSLQNFTNELAELDSQVEPKLDEVEAEEGEAEGLQPRGVLAHEEAVRDDDNEERGQTDTVDNTPGGASRRFSPAARKAVIHSGWQR